jgi:hypothetical protein
VDVEQHVLMGESARHAAGRSTAERRDRAKERLMASLWNVASGLVVSDVGFDKALFLEIVSKI